MKHETLKREVVLGVDTHLDTHVAAIIDGAGRLLERLPRQLMLRGI